MEATKKNKKSKLVWTYFLQFKSYVEANINLITGWRLKKSTRKLTTVSGYRLKSQLLWTPKIADEKHMKLDRKSFGHMSCRFASVANHEMANTGCM